MPFHERCEILRGFSCVHDTVSVNDKDNSVCEALERLKPDYFANGGDRKKTNTPEMAVCNDLGIELVWNMGGGKIQSSSDLVTSSPMKAPSNTHEMSDLLDLRPSRVQILCSDDIPKK